MRHCYLSLFDRKATKCMFLWLCKSACLSEYLYVLSVCLYVKQCYRPSIRPYLSTCLSVYPIVSTTFSLTRVHVCVYLPICVSKCALVYCFVLLPSICC